jgi:hypothetical protein
VRSDAGIGDPLLDSVLREIAADRPRSWKDWIRRHDGDAVQAVEDQLTADGTVVIERRTLWGDRVDVVDPTVAVGLRQRVWQTLSDTGHIEQLEARDVAMTALAANGEVSTAISDKERKVHKNRIRTLTERVGPIGPALKGVILELKWVWRSLSPSLHRLPGPR